jgi:hypothetical protein
LSASKPSASERKSVVLLLELVLLLMICAVALGWLARHFKFPYPIALVVGGALLGLIPEAAAVSLRPAADPGHRAAADPLPGRAADLLERLQGPYPPDQPAGDRPGDRHHAGRRRSR